MTERATDLELLQMHKQIKTIRKTAKRIRKLRAEIDKLDHEQMLKAVARQEPGHGEPLGR